MLKKEKKRSGSKLQQTWYTCDQWTSISTALFCLLIIQLKIPWILLFVENYEECHIFWPLMNIRIVLLWLSPLLCNFCPNWLHSVKSSFDLVILRAKYFLPFFLIDWEKMIEWLASTRTIIRNYITKNLMSDWLKTWNFYTIALWRHIPKISKNQYKIKTDKFLSSVHASDINQYMETIFCRSISLPKIIVKFLQMKCRP